jgi:hypothetical protein
MWKNIKVKNQTSKNQEFTNSWKIQKVVLVHIDKISMYIYLHDFKSSPNILKFK